MTKKTSTFSRGAFVAALMLSASAVASTASAQGTGASTNTGSAQSSAPATATSGAGAQEIIVTGSRLGRTAFDSPTPLNVIDAKRLQDLAIPAVAEGLNQLPAFRPINTPTTDLFRGSSDIAANSVDLRGLGANRTLVMIDGRRVAPNTDLDWVDLNTIPSSMIKRTDVVTGGASAQYGADAVTGVVNLILDTQFVGFKTDFNGGITEVGDGTKYELSGTWGHEFMNGRLHLVAGAEFQHDDGVGICIERPWCGRYTNFVGNPGYYNGASHNGLPAFLVLDHVLSVQSPAGTLVSVKDAGGTKSQQQQQKDTGVGLLAPALQGLRFSDDGQSLVPFQFGNYLSGIFMQGGDPSITDAWYYDPVPLVVRNWHASTLEHADFDINDNITAFAEFMFSRAVGGPAYGTVFNGGSAVGSTGSGNIGGLSINNPFITPAVRSQLLAADPTITQINVFVARLETGPQTQTNSTNDVYRGVAGLKGHFLENWNWDVAYVYGETNSLETIDNTALATLNGSAANAITPPGGYAGTIYHTPAGAPVICASSVANPNDGCIPVNFLGLNAFTPEVLAKYYKSAWQTRYLKEEDVTANLRTTLFNNYWAGPLRLAAGGEYRTDFADGDVDPITKAGLFQTASGSVLPTTQKFVEEGYVETELPLLANLPFVKSLSSDVTGRYTHYSSVGDAKTWKIAVQWNVNDQIKFRFTKSADVRAPTPQETNPNVAVAPLPLLDPLIGTTHIVNVFTGGNPNLDLEHAITKTAGIVLQPNFIRGLRISYDYYDINVKGAIDALTGPPILSACSFQGQLCNLITAADGGPSTQAHLKAVGAGSVFANYQNLSKLTAKGSELVVDYALDDFLGGDWNFDLNGNYVEQLQNITATGTVIRFAGVTGNAGSLVTVQGVPYFKLDGLITYSHPTWSVTVHGRFIPESILDPAKIGAEQSGYNINLANSVTENHVSKRVYVDISGTWRPDMTIYGGKFELYGAMNNMFDEEPPPQLRFFGNPLHYDPYGRAFRFGVRTSW